RSRCIAPVAWKRRGRQRLPTGPAFPDRRKKARERGSRAEGNAAGRALVPAPLNAADTHPMVMPPHVLADAHFDAVVTVVAMVPVRARIIAGGRYGDRGTGRGSSRQHRADQHEA